VPFDTLRALARTLGVDIDATTAAPEQALRLRPVRIGLWDRYGGSMPSGWTRWLLEQFEFPFEVVYPSALDAGSLNDRFDVLVFVTGAIPAPGAQPSTAGQPSDPATVPEAFRGWLGSVTAEHTVPRLRVFLENGGTILTIGSSTALAQHLGLPVRPMMVEEGPGGVERRLPRERYYVPGSVLRVRVDSTAPIAWGMPAEVDVMFDDSPVFRVDDGAAGVRRVAWFDRGDPLRSGWAWGQELLEGGAVVVSTDVGRGRLHLFGPEIAFRAQPHGTFKFLFNGLFESVAEPARLR
jgi:hypothetical protein